jgi:hypothetical protein
MLQRASAWDIAADYLDPAPDPFWDDPYGWVMNHIYFRPDEPGPAPHQADILSQLPHRRKCAVRGPHGLGKTTIAAWVVLWFATTREKAGVDWKVVTTASVWRQLEHYLWPEIRKWAHRIQDVSWDPEQKLNQLSLKLFFGSAFAVASDQPTAIEGAHADHILYILDEAKAILPETWDAVEGAFSTGEAYALAISTPGATQGRFYDIHRRRPGYEDWWVRHVTLQEAIKAGRVNEEWAEARKRQWGEQSSVYQNRVLGEFAAQDESAVIPLAWLEAAQERWHQFKTFGSLTQIGLDVARSGGDKTVFALRHQQAVSELIRLNGAQTMETTGRLVAMLQHNPKARAVVDVIGVGAGVVDRTRELLLQAPNGDINHVLNRVWAFNGAEGTRMRDFSGELGFLNKRSASWWTMREILDPRNNMPVALPDDDNLTGDLTAPMWGTHSRGLIQVEKKDDLIKRLGRSPDDGDAVVQAFWTGEPMDTVALQSEEQTRALISPF